MGAPPQPDSTPAINELARIYHAAHKLMLGQTVKCRRCLAPLRFDESVEGQIGIICDTGCTRFYLDVKNRQR